MINIIKKILREIFSKFNGLYFLGAVDKLPAPLSKKEEEVRLYRIMDLTLNQPLGQRIFGLGTIHCCTADKSTPEFDIKNIKNSREIKNQISDLVEKQREEKRVSSREFMDDGDMDHDIF